MRAKANAHALIFARVGITRARKLTVLVRPEGAQALVD